MRTGVWRGAAVAAAAVLLVTGCDPGVTSGAPPRSPLPSLSIAAAQPSRLPTSTTPTPLPPSARETATRRLAGIATRLPDHAISVAVLNTRTGAGFHWGETGGMWTGSVYKLLVLEALLLQRQRSDGWFSSSELADITAMIEQSDNMAGYRMFLDAGGDTAVAAAARRLGLRRVHLGIADPALTTMSARDGIALLHNLVGNGPLQPQSRAFVIRLMRNVQADQRWGVAAVADRGTRFANKNGWMEVGDDNGPGEDDDGHWLVNSIGIVTVRGQRLLISIFTKHNPDCYTGIDLVEKLARVVVPAVVTPV